ncbi:MAG TPA: hypothetical protein VE961_01140 [Pyrinomonadaceae bacterium]|nr:hypothetical protein [Pyrinomonadaceae bacterium]
MKFICFIGALALFLICAGCRSAPPRPAAAPPPPPAAVAGYPNLTARAKELEAALANKDYAKFIDLTYPKVVELGGGRDKLLAEMTREMQSWNAEGVELLSATCGAPGQFVSDNTGIYAVVPVTTKIKAKDGIFQTDGSLIGVSTDGGVNWTFVDATGKDQTELKQILPNLDKLNLPAEKPPVKISD